MSRGFTLIEILVVLTIMGLLTGGGVLYLTRSNAVEKVENAKQEILSNLRYARDLAITNQVPSGYFGSVSKVAISLNSGGVMSAWTNTVGVGSSYFSKDLTPDGVVVSTSSSTIGFSMYQGRFVGVGDTVVITISSPDLTSADDKKLIINESGLINDL